MQIGIVSLLRLRALVKPFDIDGSRDRQDLRLSLVGGLSREKGGRISLGTDAHHPSQLAFMDFSLAAACSAKFPKGRILSFMSAEELRCWVNQILEESRVKRAANF